MDLTPAFTYGPGPTVVQLSITQKPWTVVRERVGGHRVMASGIPVSRIIRRDHLLDLHLRLMESEYPGLATMVDWAQDASDITAAFLFHPDTGAPGISVYLHRPVEGLTYTRGEYLGEVNVDLTLRKADGTPWNLSYYG